MIEYTTLGNLIAPAKVIRCGKGSFPVLSMTMHDGIVLQSERFKKSLASIDQSDYKVVKRGQLVVGFPIDEGVLYVQKAADEGIMSPAYNVWDINTEKIDADFLELCLHSPQSMQYYKDKLRGTTARRRSIPTSDLLALKIRIPDMQTQREVVAIIRKAEAVIAARQEQLDHLDQLVKSRFIELFGDPVKNSKGMPTVSGETLFKLSNGKALPNSKRYTEGIPAYGGNGISWYTDEILCDFDTIIVGRVGFQSGNVHLAKAPLWVTDNAMYISGINSKECDIRYLCALMEHIDFTRYQDDGDLKKITQKPFMQMHYLMPPIALQRQYVAFVEQTDKSKLCGEMEVAA